MKKITIVSISSLVFLLISSAVAYFLRFASFDNAWVFFGIGLGTLLLSLLVAVFVRENITVNAICFFISSVALGFFIRSWYIFRDIDNSFLVMALVSVAAVLYLCFFALISRIPFISKHLNLFVWIYIIFSTAIYLVILFTTQTTFVSTFGYYMIVESAFILAMCREAVTLSDFVRVLALSTYSIFAVAILIAICMIAGDGADCDCDAGCCECCDCSGSGDGNTKKKKQK